MLLLLLKCLSLCAFKDRLYVFCEGMKMLESEHQCTCVIMQEMHLALRLSAHDATRGEQELVALERATAAGLCCAGGRDSSW
jgi:hypothetical protein